MMTAMPSLIQILELFHVSEKFFSFSDLKFTYEAFASSEKCPDRALKPSDQGLSQAGKGRYFQYCHLWLNQIWVMISVTDPSEDFFTEVFDLPGPVLQSASHGVPYC